MTGDEILLKITNTDSFENNIVKFLNGTTARLPAREGSHYKVVSQINGEESEVLQNLIIMQSNNDLVIIAEDDAVIYIKEYFMLANKDEVSFELFTPTGNVNNLLSVDNSISINDTDIFYYAQGDKKELLELIQDQQVELIHDQQVLIEIISKQEIFTPVHKNIYSLDYKSDYLPMGGLLGAAAIGLGAVSGLAGSGGGDNVAFNISGLFVGGPAIEDNDLQVYIFNDEGQQLTSSVKVDDDGSYSISIPDRYTGPILIQVRSTGSDHDYIDEATNESVNLTTSIRAIAYANGSDLVINTNAVTEMAVRHMLDDTGLSALWIRTSEEEAAREAAQELANLDEQSISEVYRNLADAFGLYNVNLLTIKPITTNDEEFSNKGIDAQSYGRILAALSALEEIYGQSTTNVINGILDGLNDNEFDTHEFNQLIEAAIFIDSTDHNADGNKDYFKNIQDSVIVDIAIRNEDDEIIEDSIVTAPISSITATLNRGLTGDLKLYGRVDGGEWIDISDYVTGPDLVWIDIDLAEGEHRIELVITNNGLIPADDGSNWFSDSSKESYVQDTILPTIQSSTITIKPEEDDEDEEDNSDDDEDLGEPVEVITDASSGTIIILKIVFSESMDTNITPIIKSTFDTFISPRNPEWSDDGLSYTLEYTLADADEDITEITFEISNARDVLGNEIEESTVFIVNGLIDTLNPIKPTVNYQATAETMPTVSGFVGETALEDGSSLTVRIADQIFENVEVADDGSWQVGPLEPLSEGTYDVRATVTDENGNETTSDENDRNDLYIGNGPTIVITSSDDDVLNINEGLVIFTFTFSDDVIGFTEDDINIQNGTKGTFTQISDSIYTLEVTPNADASGDVIVNILENAATSAVTGLINAPTNPFKQKYDFDAPRIDTTYVNSDKGFTSNDRGIRIIGMTSDGEEKDEPLIQGDVIRVEIKMTEYTIVDITNGVPTFTISLQGDERDAIYNEDESDGEILVFLYTVTNGDNDPGGIFAPSRSLDLNGASMLDEAGNEANHVTSAVSSNRNNIVVDTSPPSIESLEFKGLSANGVPKNSALEVNDIIRVEVKMDEITYVDVANGTPSYIILIGGEERQANYVSGSGTSILIFNYIVVDGDSDNSGITSPTNGFQLNGAILKDERDYEVQELISPPSLASQNNILVGNNEPNYTSFRISENSNTITLTFDRLLDSESLPAIDTFVLNIDNDDRVISEIEIQGRDVIVTYEGDVILAGQRIELNYDQSNADDTLQGENQLPVDNFNIIRGAEGIDDLVGIDGEIDIFIFDDSDNDDDDIIGFSFSDGDKLDLSDFLNYADGEDIANYIEVEDQGDGSDVVLTLRPNATSSGRIEITLNDIGTGSLTLNDFAESIIV